MSKIVVIGSSNVDMIMKMEHLPARGETVTDAEYMQVFGGKGANQAVGAARAGGDVAFVNCVGDDTFAPVLLENLRHDGINTDHVFREKGIPCGTALVMIGNEGDNYLSVAPGANYRLTPELIDRCTTLIRHAEIVLLQYEILPETLAHAIHKASDEGVKILWNFAPAREIDRSLLSKISILVVNEVEASFLSGLPVETDDQVEKAASVLLSKGVETVIITLGSRGSYLASSNLSERIPAFRVEAVDTTAAGDIYCGTLAVALTEGKTFSDAIRFASAAAAISVTRMGAQPSAPRRREIEEFLLNYKA